MTKPHLLTSSNQRHSLERRGGESEEISRLQRPRRRRLCNETHLQLGHQRAEAKPYGNTSESRVKSHHLKRIGWRGESDWQKGGAIFPLTVDETFDSPRVTSVGWCRGTNNTAILFVCLFVYFDICCKMENDLISAAKLKMKQNDKI